MQVPLNVKFCVSIRTDMTTVWKMPRYNSIAEVNMHCAWIQAAFRWEQQDGAGAR